MSASGSLGGIWLVVRRSLRQHRLSTIVTVLSVALGCGLVMGVFTVSSQANRAFTGGEVGFDAVLGARGSKLQLVLNTVFHLETSPGNIPWTLYEEVRATRGVELAVPYAVGDNYQGFRIVGTTTEIFTDFEYSEGEKLTVAPGGRIFDPALREAVIGSTVAARTGLQPGSRFTPYHGTVYDERTRHDEEYLVTGVLEPTGSPSDRVVWIPIEGIFRMGDHVLRGTGEDYVPSAGVAIPDEHKEVSAVMLVLSSPLVGQRLDGQVNRQGTVATLAWPVAAVMADLFDRIGWMTRVLEVIAYLVVLVAAASILASLTNTLDARRGEFAVLRALGARRRTVLAIILAESTVIALLGALVGFLVHAGIVLGAGQLIRAQTGVVLDAFAWHPSLAATPAAMLVLGALAGALPAYLAYRTDVATHL
jgi:putative ABC transport system permease protein